MVISPYARPGFVLRSVHHQASVVKFVETLFGLPPLHDRDPAAQDGPETNDFMEAFDFTQTPNAPLVLSTRSCLLAR